MCASCASNLLAGGNSLATGDRNVVGGAGVRVTGVSVTGVSMTGVSVTGVRLQCNRA